MQLGVCTEPAGRAPSLQSRTPHSADPYFSQQVDVTTLQPEAVTEPPAEGLYIHGQ